MTPEEAAKQFITDVDTYLNNVEKYPEFEWANLRELINWQQETFNAANIMRGMLDVIVDLKKKVAFRDAVIALHDSVTTGLSKPTDEGAEQFSQDLADIAGERRRIVDVSPLRNRKRGVS